MADNFFTGTSTRIASRELSLSGDISNVQLGCLVGLAGSEGSWTLTEICGADGLTVKVGSALPTGTNTIGKVQVNASTNVIGQVNCAPQSSGGMSMYKNIDVDESEDEISSAACNLYHVYAANLSASMLFLKFYNALAATVVVGTTVPNMTLPIPTQGNTDGVGAVIEWVNGVEFTTALTVACTTGVADNDAGAPGANEMVINVGYKA